MRSKGALDTCSEDLRPYKAPFLLTYVIVYLFLSDYLFCTKSTCGTSATAYSATPTRM